MSGWRSTIAGRASITVSSPFPGEISPKVESRKRSPSVEYGFGSSGSLAARAVRRAGAPCGTTRTFSAGQEPEPTSNRSAVSVITTTSSASPHSSASTSA